MFNNLELVKATREGGQVTRCHTYGEYIGTYNVAIHSYNVVSMLLLLWSGEVRPDMLKYALWHDFHERWTGDLPNPLKEVFRDLSLELIAAEAQVEKAVGLQFIALPNDERNFIKALDVLECWMWAKDQKYMGNQMVLDMLNRINKWFTVWGGMVDPNIMKIYNTYNSKRLPELGILFPEGVKR